MQDNTPLIKRLFNNPGHPLFHGDNLVAWSVVPYDNQNRTPSQRAKMLSQIGFKRFAFDWREEHLPLLPEEAKALKSNRISLDAMWFWVDERSKNGLLPEHDLLFKYIEDLGLHLTIWIGIHHNFYDSLDDHKKIKNVAAILSEIRHRANKAGCKIALYTHFGWLARPENQVSVIKKTGFDDIGIVFSFHHAQESLDSFQESLELMMPYLKTINLSGVTKGETEILDIGKGQLEKDMLDAVIHSDFDGSIGIIGHTEGEDVELVLKRNLIGLKALIDEQ